MSTQEWSVLDAIRIAMEAEQKAAAFYAEAAPRTGNPVGRGLFLQLVEFERYHYEMLAALDKSLRDKGAFIKYEGRELPLPEAHATAASQEPSEMSVMQIITLAIATEREAEDRYTALAQRTTDPDGHAMFRRLAKEEHGHYRILGEVYWNLNNRRTWNWSE